MSGERAETLDVAAPGSEEARVLAVLVSLLGVGLVDNQLLSPVLPEIARSLGTSESAVGRTVSGYAIAAAAAALLAGPFSDASGRRRFLVGAGAVFALGSMLVVGAWSLPVFAVARIVTGAGAGIISALVVAAIADLVPYERRGRAMGWVASAYFAAPILGVPLAALVADSVGWRVNYVAFAVVGLVLAVAVLTWFHERPRSPSGPAVASGYLRFLRAKSTAAGAISAFFVTGGLTGFLLFLGAYLQNRFELSLTEVGLVFLLSGVASLAGAMAAGRLSDRVGKLRMALFGSLALALVFLTVPYASGVLLYGSLAFVGLAAAARVAPLQSLVTELVPQEARGAYVALRNTMSQCGNATAAVLAAALYELGFEYVCWMTAGFSIGAFVLLLWVKEPSGNDVRRAKVE